MSVKPRRKGDKSGKHRTPRRNVASEHWAALDEAASRLGTTAAAEVSGLIAATLTDTTAAIARCKRIRAALAK